jgi:hydroxyethylthiazole kinase-like uncharacterized protein yjeF
MKQQHPQQYNNNNNKQRDGWASEDVNIFIKQEFDFQKNLDMFDKKKVFAEIRESDETAPEELLVTLNRLPSKKKEIVNLLPTENVLDNNQRTAYFNEDIGDESDDDSQTPPPNEYNTLRIRRKSKSSLKKPKTKIMTVSGGIICPVVSPLQMAHVEHECKKASTSFEELSIENSGRGSVLLILQVLSQMDVVSPSVVILVGNNKNGAIGLVAARHLMNHGCLVTVCITSKPENLCNAIIKYESIAKKFGVEIYYNTKDLGTEIDLVVDAILGCGDKLMEIQDQTTFNLVCNTISWASEKPTLSIDFPSGIDAITGIPDHPEYMIRPKWTICLGAAKTGCKSIRVTGELYLVDIGIPRLAWKRVGIKGNTIPWGADFLVALEYDDSVST